MNLQYFHATKDKAYDQEYTVAVDVPEKDLLLDYVAMTLDDPELEIELDVGLTKVNPKDAYVRKIGRDESKSKMKTARFSMMATNYFGNSYMVQLKNEQLYLVFKICSLGKKVHLVMAYENQ